MTLDLGDLGQLTTALGLTGKDGSPTSNWFSDPGAHLKTILSNTDQRSALVATIGDFLGDAGGSSAGGRSTIPIVSTEIFTLSALIEELHLGAMIGIGALAEVHTQASATTAGVHLSVEAPLFASQGTAPLPAGPILLGTSDGRIQVDIRIELPTAAPLGGIVLGSVELGVGIPTDGSLPIVSLALRGLRLPGATESTDIIVDAASVDQLGDTVLHLVLGLVQAQAQALPVGDAGRALAGLFGLIEADGLPDFPIAELFRDGPVALARWWAGALDGPSRTAWFGYLRDLFESTITMIDGEPFVDVPLPGAVTVHLGVDVVASAGGLPTITPVIRLARTGVPGVEFAAFIRPVSLDLASGVAVALPQFTAGVTVSDTGGGMLLPTVAGPAGLSVAIGSIEAGFALDANRHPSFVLAAHNTTVGSTHYDTLDLSNGDALAEAGAGAIAGVATNLLDGLGSVGTVLGDLIGLSADGSPQVDPVMLLSDPLRAIRDRWRALVATVPGTPGVLRAILESLHHVVASSTQVGTAVTGVGTTADPYRLEITEGLAVLAVVADSTLTLSVAAHREHDLPAAAAAVVAIDAQFGLASIVLSASAPSVAFATGFAGAFRLLPTSANPLSLTTSGVELSTKGFGARVLWTPGAGASVTPWISEPRMTVAAQTVDLASLISSGLAIDGEDLLADVTRAISPADWASALGGSAQSLVGAALGARGGLAAEALASLTGWTPGTVAGPSQLSLAALLTSPETELKRWVTEVVGVDLATGVSVDNVPALLSGLQQLTTLLGLDLSDAPGVSGLPWALALPGLDLLGSLPGGDAVRLASRVSTAVAEWAPGDAALDPAALNGALSADLGIDSVLTEALGGRNLTAEGVTGLVQRLTGTDGVLSVVDSALPVGLAVHRVENLIHGTTLSGSAVTAAVTAALGAAPGRIILVGVLADGEPTLLPPVGDATIALDIDLTTVGAPAASFSVPTAAPLGLTVIRLGGKAAATSATELTGFDGQVARLRRVFAGLASGGVTPVVVAGGAAGRPSAQAAGSTGIATVVTVGAPWSPVALSDIDLSPVSDAVRLIATLIDLGDEASASGPDSAPLALGRSLVGALLARDTRGDPLTELSAPDLPLPAGVAVHGIVGTVTADDVRAAITAIVTRVLGARALVRAAESAAADALSTLGARIPLAWGSTPGGVRAQLTTDLDLVRTLTGAGSTTAAPRQATITLDISADGRWLVGGPDPARIPGLRPLALRTMSLSVTLPIPSSVSAISAPTGGRLVLVDAQVFGVRRARWVIDLSDTAALLPEVRALLGEVAATLRAEAGALFTSTTSGTTNSAGSSDSSTGDQAAAALLKLLSAVGVIGSDGGFDATSLTSLLDDPVTALRAVVTSPQRINDAAAAIRSAIGDTRTDAGTTLQLTTPTSSTVSGTVTVDLADRHVTALARVHPPDGPSLALTASWAPNGAFVDLACDPGEGWGIDAHLIVSASGEPSLSIVARVPAIGVPSVPLWPVPPDLATTLQHTVQSVLSAVVARLGIEGLRAKLADLPETDGLVDPVLSALALLGPADSAGLRSVLWPHALLSGPKAWLIDKAGGVAAALPALVSAAAATAGFGAGPGAIHLADGVVLHTTGGSQGMQIGVDLDASAFPGASPAFLIAARLGVNVRASGTVVPSIDASVGTAAGALALTVDTQSGGADSAVGVSLRVRPASSAEIILFPAGPGLTGSAPNPGGLAVAALPLVFTALVTNDPASPVNGPLEIAARIVARLGTALGLAGGTPLTFTAAPLAAFVAEPAAALAARAGLIAADGLALIADAVTAMIGTIPNFSVTNAGGTVTLSLGSTAQHVLLAWSPGAGTIDVSLAVGSLPVLNNVTAHVQLSTATGLRELLVAVGPGEITIAGAVIRPFVRFDHQMAGTTVDLGLSAGATMRLLARIDRTGLSLLAETDPFAAPSTDSTPAAVAGAVLGAVFDLAANVVLGVTEVGALLQKVVLPGGTVKAGAVLEGVILTGTDPTWTFDSTFVADLTNPTALLRRLAKAGVKLAHDTPPVTIDGTITLGFGPVSGGGSTALGLTISLVGDEWVLNPQGAVQVSLVTDSSWIVPAVPAGVTVTVITVNDATGAVTLAPGLVIGGLGIRIGRTSGPLLDAGLSIDSIAVQAYGEISVGHAGGGARLELAGLGLNLGAATGDSGSGGNGVAKGIMPAGGTDGSKPAPKFSPAISIQKHPELPLKVGLSAGSGSGPWWLTVQREFGPIYLEQVGLAVTQNDTAITSIGILIDGKASLFGFTAEVDKLSLTYFVSGGSPLSPANWKVDVEGFAISAEMSGLTLAGGLRKFVPSEGGVEYLGMLLARFGTYGLTVYGGFGEVGTGTDKYTSLFLFGAVNGPIGGVPAFFVTGIGGGFGVNRGLRVPIDLSQFATFPMIRALDASARTVDPFDEIAQARASFPAERGAFWFAAGISFNSFVLVDGIVVVAIAFGNGFELNILGLARMTLPRPQLTLVSIELALVARVSSTEGVVLVQAQLTDNSWLLMPEVRLTGGFAFAAWFAGPNRGQFVLTIGGYHPDFHHADYPVVPRLGLELSIGDFITVSGQSYFALTSEALMAGVKIEIHAQLGPAWAHLVLGADAIVFFDPFFLKARVYASIDAGVSIDVWIGTITISVHLSASVEVTGPPFHAIGKLEIGPVSVTVEIGDSSSHPSPMSWVDFLQKYLEPATDTVARALTAMTGQGTVTPAGNPQTGGAKSPDGQPDRPFRVIAEFNASVRSTVPFALFTGTELTNVTGSPDANGIVTMPGVGILTVAPMQVNLVKPQLTLSIRNRKSRGDVSATSPNFLSNPGIDASFGTGDFPIGVWGALQDEDAAKVPEGALLTAPDHIDVQVRAVIPMIPAPPDIPYRQVEFGRRRILPLLPSVITAHLAAVQAGAAATQAVVVGLRAAAPVLSDTTIGADLLTTHGGQATAAVADWRAGLASPVRLGSLGQSLGFLTAPATVAPTISALPVPTNPRSARVMAILGASEARAGRPSTSPGAAGSTSVSPALLRRLLDTDNIPRVTPATLAEVAGSLDGVIPARLVRTAPRSQRSGATVVATDTTVKTSPVVPSQSGASRAGSTQTLAALAGATEALTRDGTKVLDGTIVVLELPDARQDARVKRPALQVVSGRARVVVIGGGGAVVSDTIVGGRNRARVDVPIDSRSVIVIGGPPAGASGEAPGLVGGWYGESMLPSASNGVLIGTGCVLNVRGEVPVRGVAPARSDWSSPAELLSGGTTTTTTFAAVADGRIIHAIAVGITGSGTDGVSIGLEGAVNVGPNIVTTDAQGASVVIIGIEATPAEALMVNVSVSDCGRRITGVFAADSGDADDTVESVAAWFAGAIAEGGLSALTPPPTVPGSGQSIIRWRSA